MVDDAHRPWHGQDNPMEAMFKWFTSEIARIEGGKMAVPPASPANMSPEAKANQPIAHPNPPISVEQAPHEAAGAGPLPSQPKPPAAPAIKQP